MVFPMTFTFIGVLLLLLVWQEQRDPRKPIVLSAIPALIFLYLGISMFFRLHRAGPRNPPVVNPDGRFLTPQASLPSFARMREWTGVLRG